MRDSQSLMLFLKVFLYHFRKSFYEFKSYILIFAKDCIELSPDVEQDLIFSLP